MDIKLPKKPWYVKYRMYIMGGAGLLALIVYAAVLQLRPRTLKVEIAAEQLAVACDSDFLEYVDVNGLVCPLTSMRVNAEEGGTVERICCHNGDVLKRGDTILVLSNPKVLEDIETERRNYELQQMQHRQQLIEMQQKSITLRSQALQANFELRKIEQTFELEQEEARMGVKSQAQLQVARDEYEYNRRRTLLTIESLRHDSMLNIVGRQLIEQQMRMEAQKLSSSNRRREGLAVLAPTDGQISNFAATIGGQIATGEQVGEMGVLTDYKIMARLNEYYIDRVQSGLPATAFNKGQRIALQISRIMPQVQEHSFGAELTMTNDESEGMTNHSSFSSLRPGLTLRLQIELGQPERRLIIPRGSFYAQTGGQWIMRVDKDNPHRARRVPIKLGRQNTEFYEVIEGLKSGDQVLVSGYDRFGDAEVVEW
ncbi:MAG: efflux RND transporter periplasmic adaptor subunit [Bacteroidaceae bacterium]|nr:efflux RND transporter periplasmic adaptor subunit [Bacteroidaceae bacterium]